MVRYVVRYRIRDVIRDRVRYGIKYMTGSSFFFNKVYRCVNQMIKYLWLM